MLSFNSVYLLYFLLTILCEFVFWGDQTEVQKTSLFEDMIFKMKFIKSILLPWNEFGADNFTHTHTHTEQGKDRFDDHCLK